MKSDINILSIETATKVCSVAMHRNGVLLVSREVAIDKSHSGKLVPMIREIVSEIDFDLSNLNAVAVSKGPGSYTGLRIGVSTAKGICFAHDIPLISINTLLAMAAGVIVQDGLLCPMIDARRMEVYCAVFDPKLEIVRETKAEIVESDSFKDVLVSNEMLFFGDGAEKCKATISDKNSKFIDNVYPSAKNMGGLAYQKYSSNDFEDLAYFEPFYLKEFRSTIPKKK